MRAGSIPMLSGVGLIVVCFFASAAIRLSGSGWALAQGVAEAKLAEQLAAFEKARANLESTLAMADQAAGFMFS